MYNPDFIENNNTPKTTRYFKIITNNPAEPPKRFSGNTPDQAVRKAMDSLLNDLNYKKNNEKFTIKEITKGSSHKTYGYNIEKTTDPALELDGITYQYQGRKVKLDQSNDELSDTE